MSSSYLHRSFAWADLDVRSAPEGRTVFGTLVPFNSPADIVEATGERFTETWLPGSFARSISQRGAKVPLLAGHQRQAMPLGRAVLLEEQPGGLYGEFAVSKTVAGDEALELARDGAVSFSIGFKPIRDRWARGQTHVDRVEASLREVSLVSLPAFTGAEVAGVRAAGPVLSRELAAARLAHALLRRPR